MKRMPLLFLGLTIVLAPLAHAQTKSRFREGLGLKSSTSSRKATPQSHAKPKATQASPKRQASRPRTISRPSAQSHNYVKEEGQTVVYKKRNLVDFDDSLIEGEVRNPSEFYFVHRPEEKFGTLVKKRKNFHKEMLRDTVMIR